MEKTVSSRFRYPEVDGLRGLAILMVVGHHYKFTPFVGAVDLFFVISGFLIGGILMDKKDAPNYFGAFYARRTCRIFPLYYLVLLLFFVLLAASGSLEWLFGERALEWLFGNPLPAWSYATFTQNLGIAPPPGGTEGGGSHWLGVTWSLAVEEQFYLVLPLLIWFVSRKRLPYLLVGLILAAPLLRVLVINFYPHGDLLWYALMPCRMDALLLGVLCAYAVRNQRILDLLRARTRALYGVLAVLAVGVLVMMMVAPEKPEILTFPPVWGYTWLDLFYSCVLLIAVTEKRGPLTFVTRSRLLGRLAIVAFGMFLLHQPARAFLHGLILGQRPRNNMETWPELTVNLGALLFTIALAYVSWIFFEKRIVAWGRSFKYEKVGKPRS